MLKHMYVHETRLRSCKIIGQRDSKSSYFWCTLVLIFACAINEFSDRNGFSWRHLTWNDFGLSPSESGIIIKTSSVGSFIGLVLTDCFLRCLKRANQSKLTIETFYNHESWSMVRQNFGSAHILTIPILYMRKGTHDDQLGWIYLPFP